MKMLINRLRDCAFALLRDEAVRAGTGVFIVLRYITAVSALLLVIRVPVDKPSWMIYDPTNAHLNESSETYDQALPVDAPLADLIMPWHRWDTAWYVKIAIQGYEADNSIVFPPLYPLLIAVFAPFVGGDFVLAALVVSNLACWLAFILLFKLVMAELGSRRLAWHTLICLAAFPTSYYLVAGYTESLFLACTLGAFLAVRQRRWLLTGLLTTMASLVRLQGIEVFLPMAWIAYVQLRDTGFRALVARIPAVMGAVVGTVIYIGYLMVTNVGSLNAINARYEKGWLLFTRAPWDSISMFIHRVQISYVFPYEKDNAFALALMAGLGLIVLWKMRPAYALYVFGTLVAILVRFHDGPEHGPQFESMFRYALLLFPCFIAAAMILRRWYVLIPYIVIMLSWQYFLLDQFTHWIWVA